jgi:hypothetical protein
MSNARETAEHQSLRVCTTRALEARAALKKAIAVLRQLPEPHEITEREKHQVLAGALKRANAEIFEILFCSSMAVESTLPQIPRGH